MAEYKPVSGEAEEDPSKPGWPWSHSDAAVSPRNTTYLTAGFHQQNPGNDFNILTPESLVDELDVESKDTAKIISTTNVTENSTSARHGIDAPRTGFTGCTHEPSHSSIMPPVCCTNSTNPALELGLDGSVSGATFESVSALEAPLASETTEGPAPTEPLHGPAQALTSTTIKSDTTNTKTTIPFTATATKATAGLDESFLDSKQSQIDTSNPDNTGRVTDNKNRITKTNAERLISDTCPPSCTVPVTDLLIQPPEQELEAPLRTLRALTSAKVTLPLPLPHLLQHPGQKNPIPPCNNSECTETSTLNLLHTSISKLTPAPDVFPPLFTNSVQSDTKVAHPKPIGIPVATSSPIVAKTSVTDHSTRCGAPVGNIAQLEATAERLSTGTSSIGDAIRDLHSSLKRSDSRRSAILAASVQAAQEDFSLSNINPSSASDPLKRRLSNPSGITSTNVSGRQSASVYSPAGFPKSPKSIGGNRIRSGSTRSTRSIGRSDSELESLLTRHGPGKASVKSIRSTGISLAEISESEPISLNKAALDAADAAPPIEEMETDMDRHDAAPLPQLNEPSDSVLSPRTTDAFNSMLDEGLSAQPMADLGLLDPALQPPAQSDYLIQRPPTSQSISTFQQAQDAFVDFDGVHYEPESNQEWDLPAEPSHDVSKHARPGHARRQSYLDPITGAQMLYYPAPVPAMLNLPPKLSSKPKVTQRDSRRSQIMSAIFDHDQQAELKRRSKPPARESWLPDPLAGQRDVVLNERANEKIDTRNSNDRIQIDGPAGNAPSYQPLSLDEQLNNDGQQKRDTVILVPSETQMEPELRRPQRLSRINPDNNANRKSLLEKLSPHLRASVFFEQPPIVPQIELQTDGSAMETLDKMLDASMNAPISAFTDHRFGAKLGAETYGKAKKHQPKNSVSGPTPSASAPVKEPKKRSSMMWFKRGSSYNTEKTEDKSTDAKSTANPSTNGEAHDGLNKQAMDDGVNGQRENEEGEGLRGEESDQDDEGEYNGPPTTLLAELQLRKQQQKQRTQHITQRFPNGVHATLLEMDTVAELERKTRQQKRVNLAWEDPEAHIDPNGSDDEEVPLAIIAAKHQGAKNLADLERPLGLMEKRELEDNEPLSRRRTRLMGNEPLSLGLAERQSMALPKRASVMTLSAHLAGHVRTPSDLPPLTPPMPEPTPEEFENETLGERKRRLEAAELPKMTRPVSSSFSTELLSQFGGSEDKRSKDKSQTTAPDNEEEETLGQRRSRLQSERESREREMSYSNLVGHGPNPTGLVSGMPSPGRSAQIGKRISMADVLAAHPKRDNETRAQMERKRIEQEAYATELREAKMAAMRMQMPTTMTGPDNARTGGFLGGTYNDGRGGLGAYTNHGRSMSVMSSYQMQQPVFSNYQAANMVGFGVNLGTPYDRPATMQMQMPLPVNGNSMDRVEKWRQGVMP